MAAAIVVDNVSKKFLIGSARYSSLRDVIARPVRRLLGRAAQSETERTREFWALKDVSFEVEKGATLGIIGANGAGKSTLLKLISRVSKPTSGRITTHGRVSALIEVGAGFHPELTGRENVYLNGSILGMTKKEIGRKFDAIVDFSGIEEFIDTPVKHYSSGMYARLGFSVAAHVDPQIMLVDEVLSVGDWGFQNKCLERMKTIASRGATVILITHNMATLLKFCRQGIMLRQGEVVFQGAVDGSVAAYEAAMRPAAANGITLSDSAMEVAAVRLTDSGGNAQSVFDTGESFLLEFILQLKRRCYNPIVHVRIRDEGARSVFGTDTRRSGITIGTAEKGSQLTIRLTGHFNLLGGGYRFGLLVNAQADSECLMLADKLQGFQIRPNSKADGIAAIEHQMDVVVQ